MFEIEVFSNPVNALVGDGGLLRHSDFSKAATYDEQLVKPALLFADRITLRSHRIDLIRNQQRDIEMADRFAPLTARYLQLSKSRDKGELQFLGLSNDELLSEAEVQHYMELQAQESAALEQRRLTAVPTDRKAREEQKAAYRAELDKNTAYWDALLDRAAPFRAALLTRLFEARNAFQSAALQALAIDGLVEELPWDPLPKSRPRQIIDNLTGPNTEFERAFTTMAHEVADTPRSVMVDNELHSALSIEVPELSGLESGHIVSGAVELMRMVEGISVLPIDEVAGVRAELEEYIQPFRGFMLDVSKGVEWEGIDDAERSRLLQIAWESEVTPAIVEMADLVRSASFARNAIDVFANSGETIRAVGLAVGIAAAAGFAGFSTLSAGAAAAPPLLKALMGSIRARERVVRNRAYFVHALSRVISKRQH